MECQSSDSKKLFKVFDASKRKRNRKLREGHEDSNSVVTDDTASGCQGNICHNASAKTSLHDVPTTQTISMNKDSQKRDRDRDSSPGVSPSPTDTHHKRSVTDTRRSEARAPRSPRRNRRRDEMSLALKAGLISPTTSVSPRQMTTLDSLGHDEDSIIYAFLEDAIKKEKKKERQSRRHEDYRSGQRHTSVGHRHRHHHHRRRCEEDISRDRDKSIKDLSPVPAFNQAALFETFAKLCAQFTEKSTAQYQTPVVQRSHSHKSLQCEVMSKHDYHDVDQRPTRLPSRVEEQSRENVAKIRSQDNFRRRRSQDRLANSRCERQDKQEKCNYCPQYEKEMNYVSKLDLTSSRMRTADDRYQDYQQNNVTDRNFPEQYKTRPPQEYREYRDYERERRNYEEKRYVDQRTSRSFDVREHRDGYPDEDKWRRTTRSDNPKDRRYDHRDRRYDERDKYYDDRTDRDRYNTPHRDSRRSRRISERYERNSIASREDDYRDRDRYSEKERDSGLSVADGENSTVSGKSNYLRAMKQEIVEQREAMDKMMKLWKELMRCFKGLSPQTQGQEKAVHENAATVRESAAAQLRLWRECMRRYETVARDVGDTDARLMEEINKQRSEMAEMASMWQECLQRYREMSTDFNSLKQQLTPPEPTRLPAPLAACAEGEGGPPAAPYRLQPAYPAQLPPPLAYGSPLRQNASGPPAWWWAGDARATPRRRSSPDSRGSRDRDRERRHRQKGSRDDSRYKDKPSKPSAARSEHRHRKR